MGEEESSNLFYHETKNKQDFKNDLKDIFDKKLNLQDFKEEITTNNLYYFLIPFLKEYGWITLEVQHVNVLCSEICYSDDNGMVDKTTIYAGNIKDMIDLQLMIKIADFNLNKNVEVDAKEISNLKGTNFYNTFEYVVFKIKNYPPNYNELQEMWNSTSNDFKYKVLKSLSFYEITEEEILTNLQS